MFKDICDYANDPIEALFVRLSEDPDPHKIDLGIGVFRDDAGKVPVMQAVRRAEQRLFARDLPKSYMSPMGNLDYCRDMELLALGSAHPVLQEGRIISAQTPGAGSALRAGAEFAHSLSPDSVVWVSEPVWGHQLEFFEKAGVQIRSYRYYDQMNSTLQFDEMLVDLQAMKQNDLLLLHGCCHNPTGQDLDLEQWRAVADLVVETGAVPFVDVAYQGFGAGIEDDVAGLRLFAEVVPHMLLTVSSSKSFGIYRERAGLLSVIMSADAKDPESVRRKLRDTVRQLYFMAPDHGAAIVHEILSTPELEKNWRQELDQIRHHVVSMRSALRKTIEAVNPGFDASFLERQKGMFSCLPISESEQLLIERQFHIYMLPNARVNVAAMNDAQSSTLAEAFAFVRAGRTANAQQTANTC
jgi:aspartate aminotransferase